MISKKDFRFDQVIRNEYYEDRIHSSFFSDLNRLDTLADAINSIKKSDPVILNIGSGPGNTEYRLEKCGYKKMIAMDISNINKKCFKKLKSENLIQSSEFVQGDAINLPYQHNVFDVVIIYDMLFIPEMSFEEIVTEVKRVLKKDGLVIFDILDKFFHLLFFPLTIKHRILGKSKQTYSINKHIRPVLQDNNISIMEVLPIFGRNKRAFGCWKAFRKLIYSTLFLSKSYIVIAKNYK